MHVMDDSLSYIEEISRKFDGNLDLFLRKTGGSIEKGKVNYKIDHHYDPKR